jgi:hypothetical protein
MSEEVTNDDLVLLEKLTLLLSYKATLMHGDPWHELLAAHGFTDRSFLKAHGEIVGRFATHPALAQTFARLFQEQSSERFREAAQAKGLDINPDQEGALWNVVHDVEQKAKGFARQYVETAAEPPAPGYTPKLALIVRAVAEPSEENIAMLLDDAATVVHIDWREAPLDIIDICAQRLPDGTLQVVELSTQGVTLACGERRVSVELTETPADREAMLRACHRVLQPEHEIRVCLAPEQSDTLAFVCLRAEDWSELEREHGVLLNARFSPLGDQALFD